MRLLRLVITTIVTFLFVTGAVFWRKAIAVLLASIHKINKFMQRIRFWLLGLISFIVATVATGFVSGSLLNRFLLAASCAIFSFNSTLCTQNLGVESDPVMATGISSFERTRDVYSDLPQQESVEIKKRRTLLAFDSFNTENEGHRGITLKATNRIWIFKDAPGQDFKFTDEARREIERAVRSVDLREYYLDTTGIGSVIGTVAVSDGSPPIFSPDFYEHYKHFDWEEFRKGSDLLFKNVKEIKKILDSITDANKSQNEGKKARQLLGSTLHTLQDFYAHSNWVELGKTKFNEDLGREVICDGKGDEHTPPCSIPADPNKKDDGTPNGEPTALLKDVCVTLGAGGSHVCHKEYDPGTLDPNLKKLTSGYFIGLVDCTAPVGKNRHGTVGCSDGLNKDNASRPGYEKAFNFAVDASVDYIDQIVRPLEDKGKLEAIKALMGMKDPPKDAPCNQPNNQSKSEDKQDESKDKNQCPVAANIWGDPHMTTFDGLKYDLQTLGEFTLVKSNRSDFEVQSRHIPYNSSGSLAISSAVAMKVGRD